jgi:hypothetical protein
MTVKRPFWVHVKAFVRWLYTDRYLVWKHKRLFRKHFGLPHPPNVGLRTATPLPAGYHERICSALNAATGHAERAWHIAREFNCDRLEWDHGGITLTVTKQTSNDKADTQTRSEE